MRSHGICLFIMLAISSLPPAHAAVGGGFEITWYSIDGGGGRAMGGSYELHGVIGQADAGPVALTGGTYSLSGGYLAAGGSAPCPVDFTGPFTGPPDGQVGIDDFLGVLAQWGCTGACTADITGPDDMPDGIVGILDFLKVLAEWGVCP